MKFEDVALAYAESMLNTGYYPHDISCNKKKRDEFISECLDFGEEFIGQVNRRNNRTDNENPKLKPPEPPENVTRRP